MLTQEQHNIVIEMPNIFLHCILSSSSLLWSFIELDDSRGIVALQLFFRVDYAMNFNLQKMINEDDSKNINDDNGIVSRANPIN